VKEESKIKIKKAVFGKPYALKITIEEDSKILGWVYLYLIYNSQHKKPYGFLEDIYVEPRWRSQGLGNRLLESAIREAEKRGCYKILALSRKSRPEIHKWYERHGFKNYGIEFRK